MTMEQLAIAGMKEWISGDLLEHEGAGSRRLIIDDACRLDEERGTLPSPQRLGGVHHCQVPQELLGVPLPSQGQHLVVAWHLHPGRAVLPGAMRACCKPLLGLGKGHLGESFAERVSRRQKGPSLLELDGEMYLQLNPPPGST